MNAILSSGSAPQGDIFSILVPFLFIYGIMYFLMIRPQRLKAKKHQEKVSSLAKGAKVILDGGIHGEIDSVGEGLFKVKIADKVVIEVEQGGVRAILGDEASTKPEGA